MATSTIRQILGKRPLHAVAPETSLQEAARLMADKNVGALVVIRDGNLLGILSERDIVFRAVARSLPLDSTSTAEIMTSDPVTVDIDADLAATLRAHLGTDFRHIPVTEAGRTVGLLSYRDVPAEYVMLYERFLEMSGARASD